VYAASPTQAGAGGFNDLVVRWNGTRWSAETLPGSMHQISIQTVAGTGANDVWAFGEQGYHWNGQSWTAVAGAMIAQHAWGSGPNDWWAIVAGVVFHYDGATWRELSPGASSPVAVTGFGTSDVWLGNQGGLLHRIGGAP
jgi:hypothetical protein